MTDLVLECDSCGHLMRVSEFAIGATGTCTSCGADLRVTMANTRPLQDEKLKPMGSRSVSPDAPTEVISQVDGDHCARCGRAFRGEWDQYESTNGIVCHICANRAEGPGDVQEEIGEVKPVMAVYGRDALDMPEQPMPVNPEFEQARNREELFKRAVLVAALAMIVLAIVATMVTDFDPQPVVDETTETVTDATQAEAAEESEPELPGWVPWAVRGIQFFVGFVANVLILFLMLTWANKLPNDTFVTNLIALSVVGFGLSVLSVIIGFLAQLPIIGILWAILGPLIILYIIYSLYNLTLAELLLYFVAYILALGLITMLRIMLLAGLAQIVL